MIIPKIQIEPKDYVRKVALLALAVFALEEVVSALIFVSMKRFPALKRSLLLPSATVVTHWVLPLLVVYLVEARDVRALGFAVKRDQVGRYIVYALLGLGLPALVVGVDRILIIEFIEQIVQIGMPEEVFFRGYLLHRWMEWLGDLKGLALGAAAFGCAHIVSRVSQHGLDYLFQDIMLGFQMLLGGLVLGFIYVRARNLIPGSILHISANLYLNKLIQLLGVS
jgi:membrane protease YdiL (CAAX protease family)